MRVGIISVYVDYHRRGRKNRLAMQPGIGPLLAGLLPRDIEIEVVNETWRDPDWSRDYDLLFVSSLHADFDRARQISHYWRRRGAKTVYGGSFASLYPELCQPFFDAIVVGDPERTVPSLYDDFVHGKLKPLYRSTSYDAARVAAPRFDLIADQSFTPLCLEATRGCPFHCEFCVLTGLGTRHHIRPIANVVRDIKLGQDALRGRWSRLRRRIVGFADNNIGGNLPYLRDLCSALAPLRLQWYAAATFNVAANRDLIALMARAGCRVLYVGIESFNSASLLDMKKNQNVITKVRAAIDNCRHNGVQLISGLMISPLTDDLDYLASIPRHLRSSGLHVPTFICFESPIPGTPHFQRLAAQQVPALMPNALLRDFTGYTLTVRPTQAPVDEFIAAYREVVDEVYAWSNRVRKLADDLPYFLSRRYWFPALLDATETFAVDPQPAATRSLLAGTDTPPPESVPLRLSDFASEEEYNRIMAPWRVTDENGKTFEHWLGARRVFELPRRPAGGRHQAQLIFAAG